MDMGDYTPKERQEIETLARTLKQSRLASSESEAFRMAEEMLHTNKKVHDDFKERDKQMYGEAKKSTEIENAHKMMEAITANMAKGKSDVRINIQQIDVNKPLKELVMEEEEPQEHEEDDDAVMIKEDVPKAAGDEGTDDDFDDEADAEEEEKPLPKMPEILDSPPANPDAEAAEEEDFSVKELDQ
jgi:hypothetical protein